jgi:type I restriction enzyme, S subunit
MGFEYQNLATGHFQMPNGWELTTIQKVAQINEETITSQNAPSRIQYIDIASVDKGKLLDIQEFSFEKAPSRARRIVKDRDTLVSTVRPSASKYQLILLTQSEEIAVNELPKHKNHHLSTVNLLPADLPAEILVKAEPLRCERE